MQFAYYTTCCVICQPSRAPFLAPLPSPPFLRCSRGVPQVHAPGLPGFFEGVRWGLGGGVDAGPGPRPPVFPLGGACTPRQGVTLLYVPSICTRSVQMGLRRSQVLRPFPTPGSGTLWVAGEPLRDRRVSCLPQGTVCPTCSPSLGTNRSTCAGECSLSGPLVTPPGRCHHGPLTNGPGRIPPYCVCSGGADTVTGGGGGKPPRPGPLPASPVGTFNPDPPPPHFVGRCCSALRPRVPPARASPLALGPLLCFARPWLAPCAHPCTGTMHDSFGVGLWLGSRAPLCFARHASCTTSCTFIRRRGFCYRVPLSLSPPSPSLCCPRHPSGGFGGDRGTARPISPPTLAPEAPAVPPGASVLVVPPLWPLGGAGVGWGGSRAVRLRSVLWSPLREHVRCGHDASTLRGTGLLGGGALRPFLGPSPPGRPVRRFVVWALVGLPVLPSGPPGLLPILVSSLLEASKMQAQCVHNHHIISGL